MQESDRSNIVRGFHSTEKTALARRMRNEMTPAEARLWHHLRRGALGGLHFRRQQVIDGFIVGFYCHAAAFAVELDGATHHDRQLYDAERTEMLGRRGIEVVRIPNTRVEAELAAALEEIYVAAKARLAPNAPAIRRRTVEERRGFRS